MKQQAGPADKTPSRITTTQIDPDGDKDRSSDRKVKDRIVGIFKALSMPRNFWLICFICGLLSLAVNILTAPTFRLLESAVCRDYYQRVAPGRYPITTPIPEMQCKGSQVQSRLASLTSTMSVETLLLELMVMVPLGRLADRNRFKLVLLLNNFLGAGYLAFLLVVGLYSHALPFWLFYMAPLFYLPAGSLGVSTSLYFATVTNAVEPARRTTAFSLLYGTTCYVMLVAPSIGSTLMSIHISLPFLVAIALYCVVTIPTCLITRPKPDLHRPAESLTTAHVESGVTQPLLAEEQRPYDTCEDNHQTEDQIAKPWFQFVKGIVFAKDKTILIIIIVLWLNTMARACLEYLVPYVSLRYSWTIAEAGYLLTIVAAVSATVFLVIVPALSSLMSQRWSMPQLRKDVRIAQISLAFAVGGGLVIGLAPAAGILVVGIVIHCLGISVACSMRSAVSTLVSAQQAGQLFTTLCFFDSIASIIGMPLMASAYAWGTGQPRSLSGLPFIIGATILLLAALITLRIKLPRLH